MCSLVVCKQTLTGQAGVASTCEEMRVAQEAVALQALHKLPEAGAVQLLAAHGGVAGVVRELHAVHLRQHLQQ